MSEAFDASEELNRKLNNYIVSIQVFRKNYASVNLSEDQKNMLKVYEFILSRSIQKGAPYVSIKEWITKETEEGNTGAQCHLGLCYIYGLCVAKDYQEAIKWLTKAVEQKYNGAKDYLNIARAKEFYETIKKQGSASFIDGAHNLFEEITQDVANEKKDQIFQIENAQKSNSLYPKLDPNEDKISKVPKLIENTLSDPSKKTEQVELIDTQAVPLYPVNTIPSALPMTSDEITQGAIDYIQSTSPKRIFSWLSSNVTLTEEGFERLYKIRKVSEEKKKELKEQFQPGECLSYQVYNELVYRDEFGLTFTTENIQDVLEQERKSNASYRTRVREIFSWLADDKNFGIFLGALFATFSKFLNVFNNKAVLEKVKAIYQKEEEIEKIEKNPLTYLYKTISTYEKGNLQQLAKEKDTLILNALEIENLNNYTKDVFDKLAKEFCSKWIFVFNKLETFKSVFANILGDPLKRISNEQIYRFTTPIIKEFRAYLEVVNMDPALIENFFLETIDILRPFIIDQTLNVLLLHRDKKLALPVSIEEYVKKNFDLFWEKMVLTLENWAPFFESKTPNKQLLKEFREKLDIQKIAHAFKEHWKPFFVVDE
jgi:hypothetical protein